MSAKEENNAPLIDQYLAGELSGEALAQFTARLKEDTELAREVALQEKVIGNIREMSRVQLQQELDEIHEQMPEGKLIRLPFPIHYRVAAAVALLAVIGLGYFTFWGQKESAPTVQLLALHSPQGARGNDASREKLPVAIDSENELYHQHYQFGDTLTVFAAVTFDDLKMVYNPNDGSYFIEIKGLIHPIQKTGGEIKPLTVMKP